MTESAMAARVVRRSGYANRRSSHRSYRPTYNNGAGAYDALASAARTAAAAAAAARAEVARAESALSARGLALRRAFEASAEYASARAALTAAQAADDGARGPLLAALAQDSRYQSALSRKAAYQEQIQAARGGAAAGGAPGDLTALATAAMEQGAVLTAMEAERVNADPAARDARARMVEAQSRLDALRRRFDASIADDAQWQTARRAVDAAKVRRASAASASASASADAAARSYVPPRPSPYRYGSRYRGHPTHRGYRR